MDQSIIEALKKIKKICENQIHCDNCVFADKRGECLICQDSPYHWDINEEFGYLK